MTRHREQRSPSHGTRGQESASLALLVLILGCFFVSGLTGLTYEILWTRMIVTVIGSSPFAVSIVLTVFMGGLGLGSYVAGRRVDRVKEPWKLVRLYGILELCIGSWAFVLPVLLSGIRPLYGLLYNGLYDHFVIYNLLTFMGCVLILIVPVTFMGATLPVLSRFFVTSLSRVGTHVGRLYGLNTIGAAVGSLVCGFWMLDVLGVWGTLLWAVGMNGLVGVSCLVVGARLGGSVGLAGGEEERKGQRKESLGNVGSEEMALGRSALVIFGVSGFCAMAYEVIWVKLLGLIVGPTTYSFTIVLVTFITGLALGAMFFGWMGDRVKGVMGMLLITQGCAALLALGFSQVAGNSQVFFAKLIEGFKQDFGQLYLVKAGVLFGMMFGPTFCLGATFPLVGKLYTRSLERTGRSIGYAYAVNSVGAVLGSFVAGFVLIPYLGKENGLSVVVGLQLLTALVVGARVWRVKGVGVVRWATVGVVMGLGVVLAFQYPHWDRKMLSKSMYYRFESGEIAKKSWFGALFSSSTRSSIDPGEQLVYYGDGVGGFTTVLSRDLLGIKSYTLYNSGKPDASYPGDMATQVLLAHFPLLFHPEPKNVLVIGLASGITAGEALYYPVERLDVVDINEKVVAASEYFRTWNNNVLSDPRARLIIQDGRAHLAMTRQKYDVISSEPSNPWMAGLASLFTKEAFELARDHLNDGGIFVQFSQGYEMDWPTFAMIGRTFSEVFPNNVLINTDPGGRGPDYALIGIKGNGKLDANVAAANLKYAQNSPNLTLPDHKLFYNLILSEDIGKLFGEGPVHTENRPYLEFAAPKLLYSGDPSIVRQIEEKGWVSDGTREITSRNSESVGARIDYAVFALSLYKPGFALERRVDLSQATPEQRKRYSDSWVSYCRKDLGMDVFALEDDEIRGLCLSAQIEELEQRVAGAGNRVPYLNRLGRIYAKKGDSDEAVRCLTEVLELKPDDVEALSNLGNSLAALGRYGEAMTYHLKAVELAPEDALAHNNLGCTFRAQGRMDEAIDCFSRAVELDPGFLSPRYSLAKALISRGRLDEAEAQIDEVVRARPDDSGVQSSLGDVCLARGDFDKAADHYGSAVRLEPGNVSARTGLGIALAARGRTAEALEQLSRAVELDPNNVAALNSLAWTLATESDPKHRDGTRAVALAERACSVAGSDHPQLLDTLAAAYAESGQFERARETARRAVELARSSGQSRWAQDIEKRLGLYNRGVSFHKGP